MTIIFADCFDAQEGHIKESRELRGRAAYLLGIRLLAAISILFRRRRAKVLPTTFYFASSRA